MQNEKYKFGDFFPSIQDNIKKLIRGLKMFPCGGVSELAFKIALKIMVAQNLLHRHRPLS